MKKIMDAAGNWISRPAQARGTEMPLDKQTGFLFWLALAAAGHCFHLQSKKRDEFIAKMVF
jgi:hypothetical protein